MPWWSWRTGHAGGGEAEVGDRATSGNVRIGLPAPREPAHDRGAGERPSGDPPQQPAGSDERVTLTRIGAALDQLGVRYLADGCWRLLGMWERHAVLFTLEISRASTADAVLGTRPDRVTTSPNTATRGANHDSQMKNSGMTTSMRACPAIRESENTRSPACISLMATMPRSTV